MTAYVLGDMTWPEVAEAQGKIELALLPIGSTEQHGPNATFQIDSVRSHEFGRRLAERLFPAALLLPPISYGISYHHMAFPGTITLRPETLIATVLDVATSLKHHGITSMLILSGHGGNRSALTTAVTQLRYELGVRAAWTGFLSDIAKDVVEELRQDEVLGHADEFECSQAMELCPWVVRHEQLQAADYVPGRERSPKWWGTTADGFDQVTRNGALGDARRSSLELGRRLTQISLDRVEAFARSYFLTPEIQKK